MRRCRGTTRCAFWFFYGFVWCAAGTSVEDKVIGNKSRIPGSRTRVIGGFNAIEGRHTFGYVSLFKRIDKHQCGGTVVASDLILTAAHCEKFFDTIRIGEYDKTQATSRNGNEPYMIQTFSAVEKIPHPLFEPTFFRSDVMLVKLDAKVEGIEPVQLNANHDIPDTQSLLTLMGWGTTNHPIDKEDRVFPDVLQQALVPYVPNDICEEYEHNGNQLYFGEIFDEMMCAGRAGVDACRGDSGSPLILENVFEQDLQVGLVSWGRGCGTYPGVYTRISKVFPWIRQKICWYSQEPPLYLSCQPHERSTESPSMAPSSLGKDDKTSSSDSMPTSELNKGNIDGLRSSTDGVIDIPSSDSSLSLAAEAASGTYRRSKRVGSGLGLWMTCFILLVGLFGIDIAY